ncbi:hypothetical protein EXS71_03415 [Candidatus Uhrbacteria bacterium]|nr:hypothetical protein [Candidatus Uhrbacteria bacterium]
MDIHPGLRVLVRHKGGLRPEHRTKNSKPNEVMVEGPACQAFSLVMHNGSDEKIVVFPLMGRHFLNTRHQLRETDWGYPIAPRGQLELSRWGDQVCGMDLEFCTLPGEAAGATLGEDAHRTIDILVFSKLPPQSNAWLIRDLKQARDQQGGVYSHGRILCRSTQELARLNVQPIQPKGYLFNSRRPPALEITF